MKKRILLFGTYSIVCLTLLISSCEKESRNLPVPTTSAVPLILPVLTIGQSYGGGIVFYLDSTGRHGLITTTVSQSSAIQWHNGEALVTHATGTSVGSGRENTTTIVNFQGTGNYAASICDKLDINGYSDWFLPSRDELHLLYIQKASGKIGYLGDDFYWSSTETSSNGAWSQSFSNGANSSVFKYGSYAVRAIRAF